uniref:Endonuclease/exonuclease/phosphatase domain-containing protein n=1 Tax=Triticum urartu TaxID=4572 RepID=A0A8R7TI29_TRIUA
MVSISNHHISENAITTLVQQEGAPMWWLTRVYRPQGNAEKVAFLHELADIRDLHAGPWVLVGDFNLIVNAENKNNAIISRRMMARFRALLNRLELKELYLNG